MAWKMVDTIFPKADVSAVDRNNLLCCVTLIALSDLLDSTVFWTQDIPAGAFRLTFEKRSVAVFFQRPSERLSRKHGGRWIRQSPSDGDVESALHESEAICDRYHLDEEERDTLFTALPCLGLHALGAHLIWRKPAPFSELA